MHLRNHTQMLPSLIKESHWWSTCAKGADIRGCKARTEGEYLRTFLRVKEAAAANLEVATADTSADYAAVRQRAARQGRCIQSLCTAPLRFP